MEYELDSMMGFDKLGLYYEVHMAGIDGECFHYSIYFKEGLIQKKWQETELAVNDFIDSYDVYLGDIDILQEDDKVMIELDLGNVESEYENIAIEGILKALNNVFGIDSVILNEDSEFDF